MDADDCNGRSYVSGSGDSSMEREFTGGLGAPSVSTPNSRHTSPSRSLSANSIKVELYSDEEPGRGAGPEERGADERDEGWKDERGDRAEEGSPELGGGGGGYGELASPEPVSPGAIRLPNGKLKCDVCGMICIGPNVLMVHKRSHTGERPFQCNQCGASFTQKGNLLRHIKLHSGEKPFKCPFCNYACRRRDALTGHLRTHSVSSPTVGKPYKCSYCGRSYKQQSTLEEHRERCHSYLQSLDPQPTHSTHTQGEDLRDVDFMPDSVLQPSADKMTFIDRLANSITKRKRSTPQKFVGEKHMRLSLVNAPYELSAGFDKEGDVMGSQHGAANLPNFSGVGGPFLGAPGGVGGGAPDPVRPLRLPPPHPTCLSELTPVISSVYTQLAPLGPRMDCTGGGGGGGGVGGALSLGGREAGEGHEDLPPGRSHAPSPSNGCQDSTDTESTAEDQYPSAPPPPAVNSNHHAPPPPPRARDRHSPGHAKERDGEREREEGGPSLPPHPPPPGPASPAPRDALRVVDGEGRPVRSFRCEHCRVLFLDHVMFTIHMGCHGFRQPLECNICGHRSQDRYEFSSHIVRGEHKVG
ncbi:zinc finger protein Eos-like isoform X1 [Anguilla anguilla]|uniref:zinc finger protein Eos-like isoform X1 n=1 Tax=Anguilla anguilla TaxID=7936 RepID=UPI0015AAA67B|nr:zinc finger protein Eos-like isoform X1 [Anguilla anguilla]XP_035242746.1 zinc finger protein Eos-like isoform X1 [Anguilla anguilla]XP_035242747.1 zinc finger protein Eos-like isoform X1 [Anguilla anguilla]XP_035242748.1 zinc finger protein Eos-like isoform X1 [Anguilla anguilla]XP_035242750.1 zinc finger protein Eos-like isoform X1 [Anguilla anguilla]